MSQEPTNEQRKAIEAYVKGTLSPLIESVLTKQLGMAAVFLREELKGRAAQPLTEADIEWGMDCNIEDPTDEEANAFERGVRFAEWKHGIAGVDVPGEGKR